MEIPLQQVLRGTLYLLHSPRPSSSMQYWIVTADWRLVTAVEAGGRGRSSESTADEESGDGDEADHFGS